MHTALHCPAYSSSLLVLPQSILSHWLYQVQQASDVIKFNVEFLHFFYSDFNYFWCHSSNPCHSSQLYICLFFKYWAFCQWWYTFLILILQPHSWSSLEQQQQKVLSTPLTDFPQIVSRYLSKWTRDAFCTKVGVEFPSNSSLPLFSNRAKNVTNTLD